MNDLKLSPIWASSFYWESSIKPLIKLKLYIQKVGNVTVTSSKHIDPSWWNRKWNVKNKKVFHFCHGILGLEWKVGASNDY